jgi:hypothetical protein
LIHCDGKIANGIGRSRVGSDMHERDVDTIALRLLCEKAEERLEQAAAATEVAHHTVQLPDGTYHWAKGETPGHAREP